MIMRMTSGRIQRTVALAVAALVALGLGSAVVAAQSGDDGRGARPTGPIDLDLYPDPEESPYLLPWEAGVERACIQSNRGIVSHRGRTAYAWDFGMPVGSEVRAARGGRVVRVVERHRGRGSDRPNNLVAIDHGDGTTAYYLHLDTNGVDVEVGDRVVRGQRLADSGNVGRSLVPHLHFHVTGPDRVTIPVSFADESVRDHAGVPRIFVVYRSANERGDEREDEREGEGEDPAASGESPAGGGE